MTKIVISASEEQKKIHSEFIKDLNENFESTGLEEFDVGKDLLVLLGGDGSLNYLLNQQDLLKNNSKVIYFPTGTANDFVRSIPIPLCTPSLGRVFSILRKDSLIKIPLMQCNEKKFINVASCGAPAKVTSTGEDLLKKVTGKLSYYIAAVEQMLSPAQYEVQCCIDHDINKSFKTYGFLISQGIYAGGGVKSSISTSANFGDEFNFIISNARESAGLLTSIIELQKEKVLLGQSNLVSFFCKQLKLKSNLSIPVKLDGEPYEAKELEFKKDELSLNFYLH